MAQPLGTCGGRRADGRMTTNPVGQAEGWAGAGWIHPPGHIPPAACLNKVVLAHGTLIRSCVSVNFLHFCGQVERIEKPRDCKT